MTMRDHATALFFHIVSLPSHFFHFLFHLTQHSNVLLWEFECARYIHLNQTEVSLSMIIGIVLSTNIIVISFNLCNVLYFIFFEIAFTMAVHWFKPNNYMVHFTTMLFKNAFKFNANLLRATLKINIASYQQCISALNGLNEPLPNELNRIILNFVFHTAVQQLSSEQMVKRMLKSVWKCNNELIESLIIEFAEMNTSDSISFGIHFGNGINIGGRLRGGIDLELLRELPLRIKYGIGKHDDEGNDIGTRVVGFDVETKELFDASKSDQNAKLQTMSVFKTEIQISKQSQLKSSHQRKFLQSLKSQYPLIDDATWKQIFPPKCSVLMSKLSTNKIILYSIKHKSSSSDSINHYFYQTKDSIYPTLSLLWKLPNFLPCILIHSPVSSFVLRGADLMLPGVAKKAHANAQIAKQVNAKSLNDVKNFDVLCIKVVGNPMPFAIGYSLLSSSQISHANNGRFIKMMHIFGDQLWCFAGKIKPNVGFLSNAIKPIQTEQNGNNENDENKQQNEEEENKNDFDEKFESLSMDNKLIFAFFSCLLRVSTNSLPVSVCDVYQSMHSEKLFKDIDVKQSSFSKLSRFALSQDFENFITCKQQKSKFLIESMQKEQIAQHLLFTLYGIKKESFDAMIEQIEKNEFGKNDPLISILFGSYSNLMESENVNDAFLNHLSDFFQCSLSKSNNLQCADDVFECQFFETLKQCVNPSDLPISASTLLTRKKLRILKPNFVLSKANLIKFDIAKSIISNIKQTRWKKSGKFLKDLAKGNIIKLKDLSSSGGELMITSINYSFLTNEFNADGKLQFFTPEQFEKFVAKVEKLQNVKHENEEKNDENKKKRSVCIKTMFRANHRLLPIFGNQNISKLHSRQGARSFLWTFVSNKQLLSSNNQSVRVNDVLFHTLFDSKQFHSTFKKKNNRLCGIEIGQGIHRKDLVNLFDSYLDVHSAVILDENEQPKYKKGNPPKISVCCDKRSGNKYMTHVQGLEVYGIEPNEFKIAAKKFFASAVTLSDLKGKKAKMRGGGCMKMVSIQGNFVKDSDKKDVTNLLMKEYGVPQQLIDANTKITKKAKN